MSKATLNTTKENLAVVAASVEVVKQDVEGNRGRIDCLERNLVEAETRVMEHADGRLDKQGRVCKEVNERSAEMLKSCQQARALGESASAAIKKLSEATEKHRSEDISDMTALRDQMMAVSAKVMGMEELVASHSDSLKSADREVQHLRTWTDHLKDLQRLQGQHSELASSLQEHVKRLDRAERDIMEIHVGPMANSKISESVACDLKQHLDATAAEVKQLLKWKEVQKSQCDVLSSAGRRIESLEASQSEVVARTEIAEHCLQDFGAWRREADERLDAHGSSLQQLRTDFCQAQERMEATTSTLQGLRGDVQTSQDVLAKLGSRVDTCCKYFNGLGKGLQDTHRQIVNGESGLLPPKAVGSLLPAIPRTPRALKAGSPSPRR
mmetsp:Transcript_150533/g.382742  ORF Transcript_150533/g.382742 Transcript_150533/m.382742 type:complete len:383 (+) Transcript_150533:3-1151(+)